MNAPTCGRDRALVTGSLNDSLDSATELAGYSIARAGFEEEEVDVFPPVPARPAVLEAGPVALRPRLALAGAGVAEDEEDEDDDEDDVSESLSAATERVGARRERFTLAPTPASSSAAAAAAVSYACC